MKKLVIRNVGLALDLPIKKEEEDLLQIVRQSVNKIIGRETIVSNAEFKAAIQEAIPYSQSFPDDYSRQTIELKRKSSWEWLKIYDVNANCCEKDL